jgi:hypothetical protein
MTVIKPVPFLSHSPHWKHFPSLLCTRHCSGQCKIREVSWQVGWVQTAEAPEVWSVLRGCEGSDLEPSLSQCKHSKIIVRIIKIRSACFPEKKWIKLNSAYIFWRFKLTYGFQLKNPSVEGEGSRTAIKKTKEEGILRTRRRTWLKKKSL